MKVLAIVNQKGGVGKTTTAVNLAHGLARAGRRVILIDLDAQGNCADALGMRKNAGIYEFLVLDANAAQVTIPCRENLDLIAGNKTTVKAKKIIAGESFSEYVLRNHLERLDGYDVAILDSAPGADVLQINALVAATHLLVPVSLAFLATVGAVDVLGTVASLKKVGAYQGTWLGLLPTMWDRTTNESQRQLSEMVGQFKRYIWPPIPVDVKAREAPRSGQTLWEYAPDGRAVQGVEIDGHRRGGYQSVIARLQQEVEL